MDTPRRIVAVLVSIMVATVVAVGLAGCGSTVAPGSGGGSGAGGGAPASTSPGAYDPDGAVSSSGAAATTTAASFSGTVTDARGAPVAQVMVTATSIATPPMPVPELAVLTDASGHYAWYGLAPGPYAVSVSTPTARAGTETTVVAGRATVADLVLR